MLVNPVKLARHMMYGKGLYENKFSFNGDFDLWGGNGPYERVYADYSALNCFGVVDNPHQFQECFGQVLEDDKRPLVVLFDHVLKNPENAGKGGGWRWYKLGPYYGKGKPEMEYLDDEEGFEDGVWAYHIYDVTGFDLV